MGKWLDLARLMNGDCANSANSADSPPIGTNGTIGTGSLPPALVEGIRKLRSMRPPRSLPRKLWAVFVADAVWLADYGVAADALSQGWTPLDLFGVSADEEWQSLAAWIGGRRDEFNRACILLQEIRGERKLLYAVQSLTAQRRWHYPDPAPPDARLAWKI